MCDMGQSLKPVCEHTLKSNYDQYALIIVPKIYFGIEDETINELKKYVQNGESLLIVESKTSLLFAEKVFGFEA